MIFARRLAVVLLVALATVLVAACGGSPSDPSAQSVLKETFGANKPVRSGKLDVAVSFSGRGLRGVNGPIRLSLKGPFASQGGTTLPAFDFDLGFSASGTTFTGGAVSTGQAGYVKFQGGAYAVTDALYSSFKKGYEASAKGSGKKASGPSLRSLGVDPLRWLRNPKTVGEEQVGGADTRHVSATVDVPKLLADIDTLLQKAGRVGAGAGAATTVPSSLTAVQRQQIQDAVRTATFDVWSGKDDGTLRKLDVKVAFRVPAARQAQAGGLKDGTLALTLQIADLNRKQDVRAPAKARPLSELQAQVGQLLGGAGATGSGTLPDAFGGTGSAPPPTTTPATPAAPPQSVYLRCLRAAGPDIGKVNACAKLLNR